MTKQAKHVQPTNGQHLYVRTAAWGGFIVSERNPEGYCSTGEAAFTNADECADWLRSCLRNQTAKMFGAK